ncbi:MAG: hypothetical protein IJJ33_03590 [Victivallales bacterium]|nr:hypothetical protein [Victivallales bacterium]
MKIYLIHHTHYDIGFTDLPQEVVEQQMRHLDLALRLCGQDTDYRWVIESGSLVAEYLASRPQVAQQRLLDCLREGRMEVGALCHQQLTEAAGFAELQANASLTAALGQQHGFPVECAILDDIGGFSGALPAVLNEAGVRYLVAGVGAFQAELPWASLPHLFYLDGTSCGRLLVWNLGIDRTEPSDNSSHPFAVYGMGGYCLGYRAFEEYLGKLDMGIAPGELAASRSAREMLALLEERLQRENYPFEEILLQYGGDNRAPSPLMAELVRRLNASGDFPEIVLTTPSRFFHDMETRHGTALPCLSGVLTDPWNLRMNAVPSVLKTHRAAQSRYESLLLHGECAPNVLKKLMLTSDHTFGLNCWLWQNLCAGHEEALRIPGFDRLRRSWQDKALYAETALAEATELERKMRGKGVQDETEAIVVANQALHDVCGQAELYLGSYSPELLAIRDEDGQDVPCQQIGHNRWLVQCPVVPALGKLRLHPVFGTNYPVEQPPGEAPVPAEVVTDFFQCTLSGDGEVAAIRDATGEMLVAPREKWGRLEHETIHDIPVSSEHCGMRSCKDRTSVLLTDVTASLTGNGPLFAEVTRRGRLGDGFASVIMRFWKHLPRIDFLVRLDLPESPAKTATRIVFPFAGEEGDFTIDQNAGWFTPTDLLPGAMQDLFLCSRFVLLNAPTFSATLCTLDAPVVELGTHRIAQWRRNLPFQAGEDTISALLRNNICNTDAPPWSPILDTFRYSMFIGRRDCTLVQAQNAWESVTALTASLGYDAGNADFPGLPAELRGHVSSDGRLWLENLTDTPVACRAVWRDRDCDITVEPRQLVSI